MLVLVGGIKLVRKRTNDRPPTRHAGCWADELIFCAKPSSWTGTGIDFTVNVFAHDSATEAGSAHNPCNQGHGAIQSEDERDARTGWNVVRDRPGGQIRRQCWVGE